MRIGVNTRLLLKHRMEGIAVFTWEICRRLATQHPEDQFYFFFDRTPDQAFTQLENVHAVVIKPQARHDLLWKYWFDFALPRAFKKYQIDVFFSPESYLSLATTIPTVLVTHDLCFLHYPETYKSSHLRYFKKYAPLFHERADHIIAVSETTKKDIQQQYKIEDTKITVAYNAARESFQPLSEAKQKQVRQRLTGGSPYILYLGSVHPRKNVAGLIRAFKLLQDIYPTDHRLVLFGRWAFGFAECERLIVESNLSERIVLAGDEDGLVEEVIGATACLVYPSFYEGFGIPIVEAMACGVPVVTSGRGAMKEVGGDAAIFVNPDDDKDIAKGIKIALNSIRNDKQLLQRAYKNIERFSWDESAHKIDQVIKKLT